MESEELKNEEDIEHYLFLLRSQRNYHNMKIGCGVYKYDFPDDIGNALETAVACVECAKKGCPLLRGMTEKEYQRVLYILESLAISYERAGSFMIKQDDQVRAFRFAISSIQDARGKTQDVH